MIDQGLQEGPAAAGEPAQVWESRRHVQSDLPQRRFGPPQLETTLLRQAHLRKTIRSQWRDARTLPPPCPRRALAFSGLECSSSICGPSRHFPCVSKDRFVAQNARTRLATSRRILLLYSSFLRHPRLMARQDARILYRSVVVKQDNMSRRFLVFLDLSLDWTRIFYPFDVFAIRDAWLFFHLFLFVFR